jgi:DNA-binding winged helix-turn-helix (wHTH) protein/Tfp pilus assembly protein PilF
MQFGGYRIDTVHRTIAKPNGTTVRLEPKAFDLLAYFVEHPDETLSRDRLIADVWGGKFVTDDAVMVAVYALRQAFDDDSRAPKFIETIRGRGYRWIAKASEDRDVPPPSAGRTAAVGLALATACFAVLVWGVLRPKPMPSMQRTNELVRAHARGLFFSERSTRRDLEEARVEFAKAIHIDDRFAEPHAALAEVCVRLIEFGAPHSDDLENEARREVAHALQLGPRLAITHAALASVQFVLDRDTERAERSFRYAMDLDPSLPDIHRRYSYLLGASGRFVEATEQARIATEMEPTSAGAFDDLAWTYFLAGNLTEAERVYREALRLDPSNTGALFSLGYCLELRNAPAEAMQSYHRAMQSLRMPDDAIARYDKIFATSGLHGVYETWLEQLKPNKNVPRMMVALYAARVGRSDEAIELLRESAQRHEAGTLWLAVHPAFASLRNQREFAAIVASSFHTR